MFRLIIIISLLSANAFGVVSLRMTDKSENLNVFKVALKANRTKGLKLGDELQFTINKGIKRCDALVRNLADSHLTIFVKDIKQCWDTKQALRRGASFNFDEQKIEAREIEADLTKQELEVKRKDFINQLNDINLYLYNFGLRKKKLEAEYNNRIRALKLEKVKALEELYRERKAKSEIQLRLKSDIDRVKEANRYFR